MTNVGLRNRLEEKPGGTVGLPCGEMSRFSAFTFSLSNLQMPPGTQLSVANGLSIARNLNELARSMTGEWFWFMGDDHVFDPGLLIRLLDRDVGVVVPICIRRKPPFAPVIYKEQIVTGQYQPFAYDEIPREGLFPVYAAGTAGMLVRREVMDAIGDPWFSTTGDIQNEDLEFCRKVREAGYTIYADANERLGHIGLFTIWPKLHDGDWGFEFDFGPGPDGAANSLFMNIGAREADARAA